MRAALIAGAIVLWSASDATAGPFCLVSAYGRNCSYYMLSDCQRAARPLDGACVANTEQGPPPIAEAPPPSDGRAYADVAGSFQRGYENSQRRDYDQEARELDLERLRLENERLRQSMAPPPPQPDEGEVDSWTLLARGSRALGDGMFPRPQPGWYEEARVEQCEGQRAAANQIAARETVTWDEIEPAYVLWQTCIGPNLHPELLR